MPAHDPQKTVILLAEDEVTVRNMVNLMLSRQKYAVLIAADGVEALEICQKFSDPINLLLTNVDMPGMSGIALAEAVLQQRPSIKVVIMSGNMDNAIIAGNRPDAFLSKPFVPPTLLKAIRQVLDGERPGKIEV